MEQQQTCAICRVPLNSSNIARWEVGPRAGEVRLDGLGRPWCQPCTDKHDSIDWDDVNERGW